MIKSRPNLKKKLAPVKVKRKSNDVKQSDTMTLLMRNLNKHLSKRVELNKLDS